MFWKTINLRICEVVYCVKSGTDFANYTFMIRCICKLVNKAALLYMEVYTEIAEHAVSKIVLVNKIIYGYSYYTGYVNRK